MAFLLAGLFPVTSGLCRPAPAISAAWLGLGGHNHLHPHGVVASLRLYDEEDKKGLVIQLANVTSVADYRRLVPGS